MSESYIGKSCQFNDTKRYGILLKYKFQYEAIIEGVSGNDLTVKITKGKIKEPLLVSIDYMKNKKKAINEVKSNIGITINKSISDVKIL